MEKYHFIMRFDDEQHSLTRYDGVPAEQVGELLVSLTVALGLTQNPKSLILSEIRGNCYALEFSTEDITVQETFKVVHEQISNNSYKGLNIDQRKYAQTLKSVLGTKLKLKAYDDDKSFEIRVEKIEIPKVPTHYFELGSAYGIITSIGGSTLDGKANIRINQEDYHIEISPVQEQDLIQFYKKGRLRFSIRKKINFETDKVMSAELLEYEVLEERNFHDLAEIFRWKHPDAFIDEQLQTITNH